jgi:hypothetical protein
MIDSALMESNIILSIARTIRRRRSIRRISITRRTSTTSAVARTLPAPVRALQVIVTRGCFFNVPRYGAGQFR